MLSKEIEEMVIASENKVNTLEYKLPELFRQAEEASGLKPVCSDYIEFKLGNTKVVPMVFMIDDFEDIDDTSILNNAEHRQLSGKEFLEMLKAYDEKLSSLLAENYGSRYTFKILSKKYTLKKLNTEFTRIYAEIEDTEEHDHVLLK